LQSANHAIFNPCNDTEGYIGLSTKLSLDYHKRLSKNCSSFDPNFMKTSLIE